MQIKNINFFERHVEKFILGVAAIVITVIAWYFLLGTPYAVKLGEMENVSPGRVNHMVKDAADQLADKISDDTTSPLPPVPVPPYADSFRELMAEAVQTPIVNPIPMGQPGIDKKHGGTTEAIVVTHFDVPTPPPLTELHARDSYDVLGDRDAIIDQLIEINYDLGDDAEQYAEQEADKFAEIVVDQAPRDFSYVSVSGEFDLDGWRKALSLAPGESRIPESWWRDYLLVVDVILERREQVPATGQWSEPVRVGTLPGALTYRHDIDSDDWTQNVAVSLIQEIRNRQDEIRRAEFPPTSGDHTWLPPDAERIELDEDGHKRLRGLNKKIRNLRTKLERMGVSPTARRFSGRRGIPGGLIAPEFGGIPGGFPGAGGRGNMPDTARTSRRKGLEAGGTKPRTSRSNRRKSSNADARKSEEAKQQIANFQRRLQEALDAKDELLGLNKIRMEHMDGDIHGRGLVGGPDGMREFGIPGPGREHFDPRSLVGPRGAGDVRSRNDRRRTTRSRQSTGAIRSRAGAGRADARAVPAAPQPIKVWAHDLTVEPGKSYQYRLRVAVLNPLFLRRNLTPAQKEQYYNQLALESAPSEWSDTIETEPDLQFFIVDANTARNQAEVEVWRIVNGQPRSYTFTHAPGDKIGSTVAVDLGNEFLGTIDVDFSVQGVIVDVVAPEQVTLGRSADQTRVLWAHLKDDTIEDRFVSQDRDHKDRIRLRNEAELAGGLALGQ